MLLRMRVCAVAVAACLLVWAAAPRAQDASADAARRHVLDQILDTYVRDGFVYYRALKAERAKLDGFVAQLDRVDIERMSEKEQLAFWMNAYDALVLRTVIDHYPIQGHAATYPSKSLRQVPGAFERLTYRVGGKMVTLDQIEQTALTRFHDPRVFFAISRGSVGGGRLRSEAFDPDMLERQLAEAAAECVSRVQCVQVDQGSNKLLASPIFSWRQQEFVAADADKAASVFAMRTPIERAIIAFVSPKLLMSEREFLERNTFQLTYATFDWTLNDLTGRGGR